MHPFGNSEVIGDEAIIRFYSRRSGELEDQAEAEAREEWDLESPDQYYGSGRFVYEIYTTDADALRGLRDEIDELIDAVDDREH